MKPLKPLKPLAKRKTVKTPRPNRGSSFINHDYDEKSKSLIVTFAGGRKYRYSDVDLKTVEGLANASHKGAFMRASVVGKFATTKL